MRYLFLLLFCCPFYLSAQTDDSIIDEPVQVLRQGHPEAGHSATTRPNPTPVAMRTVPQQQWADASQGLDYSKDLPKPPKEAKPRRHFNPDFSGWTAATQGLGFILQVLAILVAIGLIGYAIFRMLQAPRNRVIARDGVEITVDNIDQYIHETDLERFLREALAQGNYPLAIRLYYLQVIKDLSAKNIIRWSREKTNRDYQREMRPHRLSEPFRAATLRFEEVWYGNQTLDAATYQGLEPEFKQLLANIAAAG